MTANVFERIRAQHALVGAVLRAMQVLIATGPGVPSDRPFALLRTMLLYLDGSHRCLQQPLESSVLFSKLPQACPAVLPVARQLHAESSLHELRVRELQHLLNAWQLMCDARRGRFVDAAETHTAFYLRYLRVQSPELLDPAAEWLDLAEMQALGEAAGPDRSPHPTADHDRLFRDILAVTLAVASAPAGLQWRRQLRGFAPAVLPMTGRRFHRA